MKRIRLFIATLSIVALALAAPAAARNVETQFEDGGGGGTYVGSYIVATWTYVNGYPQYLYCRYLDFGTFTVQASCWT